MTYYHNYHRVKGQCSIILWRNLNSVPQRNSISDKMEALHRNGSKLAGESLKYLFNDFFVNLQCGNYSNAACDYNGDKNAQSVFLDPTTDAEIL